MFHICCQTIFPSSAHISSGSSRVLKVCFLAEVAVCFETLPLTPWPAHASTKQGDWVRWACVWVGGVRQSMGVPWLLFSVWRYKVYYQRSMGWKTTQECTSSSELNWWLLDASNKKYWLFRFNPSSSVSVLSSRYFIWCNKNRSCLQNVYLSFHLAPIIFSTRIATSFLMLSVSSWRHKSVVMWHLIPVCLA